MKRSLMCLFLVISFLLVFSGHAFAETRTQTRELSVSGTYGLSHSVRINSIPVSSGDTEGVPFDILGEDVLSSTGRKIALWSMSSNYLPVTVKVYAKDLELAGVKIPYCLRFAYEFPVYNNDDKDYVTNAFIVGSEGLLDSGYTNQYVFAEQAELQGLDIAYNSSNCYVSFMLPEDIYQMVAESNEYPNGDYNATVVVVMEGEI